MLILDTFNDNENALAFCTTPSGIRLDFTIFNDAQTPNPEDIPINLSWDTFWDVAVVQNGEGWFAELRIPISSLRFDDIDGRVVMGLITWRWIAHKAEVDIFPAFEAAYGPMSAFKPSLAQKVVFENMRSRKPIYVTPYLLGGLGYTNELNDPETAYDHTRSRTRELGLDIKKVLTSNLTLDLTLNTDFAQVEADDQQVNLTRFSLFFPEKRRFFLERASAFDISLGGPNRIFYSRRIGLHKDEDEEGRQIPILGGARLVGRIGKWDVGAINMQTDRSEELPSENFGVLRLRRQVFNPYSYLGGIATSRIGTDGSYNITYGLDGIFRVFGYDYLLLNWAQTFEDEGVNRFTSLDPTRIRIAWEKRKEDGVVYDLSLSRTGAAYNPAVGFQMRDDYFSIRNRIGYGWAPGENSPLFRHNLSLFSNASMRNTDGSVESAELGPTWSGSTKKSSMFNIALKTYYEDLVEPFELTDEVEVPEGSYTFHGLEAFYMTPAGRLYTVFMNLTAGGFYDGRRLSLGLTPMWSPSPQLSFEGFYQINHVTFPERDEEFTTHIGRLRLVLTLTTSFSTMAIAQYNSAVDAVIANVRLRYNPQEGTDLYLVYNEGLNTDRYHTDPRPPFTSDRTLLIKYAYTFGSY